MEHNTLLESGMSHYLLISSLNYYRKSTFQVRISVWIFLCCNIFKCNFQGAEKQYYVSKKCATQNYCDSQIRGNMPLCHYLWYEDWKCAECCQGDRCNYYVTVSLLLTLQKFFYILLTTYLLLCIFNCK